VIDRDTAIQKLVDRHNNHFASRIADGWARPKYASDYDQVPSEQIFFVLSGLEKADEKNEEQKESTELAEQEPSITIELRKDDVIRMLKGSNAPAGMLWDERAMNEYSIEALMEIYAQLNWSGHLVQEQEAPRIFVPGAQ